MSTQPGACLQGPVRIWEKQGSMLGGGVSFTKQTTAPPSPQKMKGRWWYNFSPHFSIEGLKFPMVS